MTIQQDGAVRSRRTREAVRQLVSAFPASGLAAREFCQRHGLALSTLRRNLKRQRETPDQPETGVRLVAVKLKGTPVAAAPPAARAALEVVLAGGRRLGVAPGFDELTLGRLVQLLEGLYSPVGPGSGDQGVRGAGRDRSAQRLRRLIGPGARYALGLDPLSGHLVLFCNRDKTRLKMLCWDGSGLWLCTKRLEKGRYSWPRRLPAGSACLTLNAEEFALLVGGLDLSQTRRKNWYRKAACAGRKSAEKKLLKSRPFC
jgi:transposase